MFTRLNPMTEAHMQYLLMIYSEENGWNKMTDSERRDLVGEALFLAQEIGRAHV